MGEPSHIVYPPFAQSHSLCTTAHPTCAVTSLYPKSLCDSFFSIQLASVSSFCLPPFLCLDGWGLDPFPPVRLTALPIGEINSSPLCIILWRRSLTCPRWVRSRYAAAAVHWPPRPARPGPSLKLKMHLNLNLNLKRRRRGPAAGP